MGLFDRFREKSLLEVRTNVTDIVQQMFDEAGITPQRPDKNVFLTVIDGVHCSFKTILKCDERIRINSSSMLHFQCLYQSTLPV